MTFLYSIIITCVFIGLFGKKIKRHSTLFYSLFLAISLLAILIVWGGFRLSGPVRAYVLPILARGGLAGAFFIVVMITGALPNKTGLQRVLLPIRGELSILASILTLGHNIAYGRTYFVALLSKDSALLLTQKLAAVCSLLMISIMIPLFVTSFPGVRRRMKAKKWKKLQRLAYLFYALLGVHIMLLCLPYALAGRQGYRLTVTLYGTIFLSYAICRAVKAFGKRWMKQLVWIDAAVVCFTAIVVSVALFTACAYENSKTGGAEATLEGKENTSGEVTLEIKENTSGKVNDDLDEAGIKGEGTEAGGRKDGVYTGKGMGNSGPITVEIEVKDEKIVSIRVVKQMEDEPYWTDAANVIDQILERNSVEVDVVSGATYSSEGIKEAVREALAAASGQ